MVVTETGVDLRDTESVHRCIARHVPCLPLLEPSVLDPSVHGVVARHASPASPASSASPTLLSVWNLAAPLSVETELDPSVAEDVTVGGMGRILAALDACGASPATRVLFSDSIGSFGASAPRVGASAAWLVANPSQDPGYSPHQPPFLFLR